MPLALVLRNTSSEAAKVAQIISSGLPRGYRTVSVPTNAPQLIIPDTVLANFTRGLLVFAITVPEFPESAFMGLWTIERYREGRLYVVGEVEPVLEANFLVVTDLEIVCTHTATESILHLESHPI